MEPALKQRLLGAVVLIALAVIFVPMLLSGPGPKQASETVDLEIPPAPDREFETRVLPVQPTPNPAATAAAPTAPEIAPADPSIPESDRVATVDLPSRRPPESAQHAPSTTPTPAPAVAPPAASTAPSATAIPPAATAAAPPAAAAPVAGVAANGQFLVHMGVYTSTKNVDDLVAALKRGGFPAFAETTEFQGKSAQRVRVGPFADRAAAEAARVRMKQVRADVPSSIVTLAADAKADAPVTAVAANRPGGWAVQLGAFKTEADANVLRGRLQAAGIAGYVDRLAADGQTLWRVRAGPEVSRANADKLRERVKAQLKIDGMIVTQQ
ncbi:SPOR domain-containing protein [Dokdonella sp. MW10]|uniref:SPOR domain-containing protein n=1 Tax=Dokdonella sp. MW10 TaxID=2992926 RepID=UPI003F7DB72F